MANLGLVGVCLQVLMHVLHRPRPGRGRPELGDQLRAGGPGLERGQLVRVHPGVAAGAAEEVHQLRVPLGWGSLQRAHRTGSAQIVGQDQAADRV